MVRLLTPADAPAYVGLRRFMLLDAPWAFSADPQSDRGSDEAGVAASLARPGLAIAGGFEAAELVSTAVLMRDPSPKRPHLAWIVSVYTHPSARRRGHGRAILVTLLDVARTWGGLELVQLSVSERSAEARALYESLGFRAWGTEPDALRVGGKSYAETHMRLPLVPSRVFS